MIAAIERFVGSVFPAGAEHVPASPHLDPRDKAKIQWSGACLVAANSTPGSAEATALLRELRSVRADVDVLTDTSAGLARAYAHLKNGGLLAAFPEADGGWSHTPIRLLRWLREEHCATSIVPAHLASNEIRIGAASPADTLFELPDDEARAGHLRWRVESLAFRHAARAHTRSGLRAWLHRPKLAPVAPAEDPAALASEIDALPDNARLGATGDLHVYAAPGHLLPTAMREIGRLREIAFRANDEGTGRDRDLDRFDASYVHLFAWNPKTREIAGAYRLGHADGCDPRELYTATLFDYGPEFLRRLGPAIELGRSFIRPEYQRSFTPLLALWKGIGRYVADHTRYRTLFGPVSISRRYCLSSRQLMVACLERWASWDGLAQYVRERNPFPRGGAAAQARAVRLDQLSDFVADSEPDGEGMPVLLRQYLKLGGKLLGFNVDDEFSGVIDGLIVVDLTQTDPKLLGRYLGSREAEQFLSYHRGIAPPASALM